DYTLPSPAILNANIHRNSLTRTILLSRHVCTLQHVVADEKRHMVNLLAPSCGLGLLTLRSFRIPHHECDFAAQARLIGLECYLTLPLELEIRNQTHRALLRPG